MMKQLPPVAMLWDSSHIWGLMSLRSLGSLGFPVRLLKAEEIAQGALFRKGGGEKRCPLLVVPGGAAALKAEALGEEGKRQIRAYLEAGGSYLGFCGGAGLALSHSRGLGLCPWARADYPQRLLHLVSGHVLAEAGPHELSPGWEGRTPSLPVWWPGRFSNGGGEVEVLARCLRPDRDFWLADMALGSVPERVSREWRGLYGVNLSRDFLKGSELVVSGRFGGGRYVLSYSHLETPDSPDANRWLAHMLGRLAGQGPERDQVPAWRLLEAPSPAGGAPRDLLSLLGRARELVALGEEHRFFFARTPWLLGWKPGMPGSLCNSLLAALDAASRLEPSKRALAAWRERAPLVEKTAEAFFSGAEGHLLAAHLSEALQAVSPGGVDRESLSRERGRLFGHPMLGQGLLGSLLDEVEDYIHLCLAGCPELPEALV